MSEYTIWYLDVSPGRKVARGGLEEEEWFLWKGVVELLDMFGVVSADSNDLERLSLLCEIRGIVGSIPSFPASQTELLSTTF